MDNTSPKIALKVDDNGDCTHYKKGDTITGHYYVYDLNIWSWNFGSTYGGSTERDDQYTSDARNGLQHSHTCRFTSLRQLLPEGDRQDHCRQPESGLRGKDLL
jgi:hypothetical protein